MIYIFVINYLNYIIKKLLKSIALFGVLSITNLLHATDQDVANNIGHSISSVAIALNNLSQSDYCLLRNTIGNQSLTVEQKFNILNADVEISAYMSAAQASVTILNTNNAQSFISDPTRKDLVVDVLTTDFDSRPDIGGCEVYQAGRRACNANYVSCAAAGYVACLSSGPFYGVCAAAMYLACTASFVSCHDLNAAQYPNCAGNSGGGVVVTWNSWLATNYNCSE